MNQTIVAITAANINPPASNPVRFFGGIALSTLCPRAITASACPPIPLSVPDLPASAIATYSPQAAFTRNQFFSNIRHQTSGICS
jgi:hypothetical protein